MRISILKNKKIDKIVLPNQIFGNFWITDKDINGMEKNLISIEARDNHWVLVSNSEAYYVKNDIITPSVILTPGNFYQITKHNSDDKIVIYCENIKEVYQYIDITESLEEGIDIGNDNSFISNPRFKTKEAVIKKEEDKVFLYVNNEKQYIYVNDVRIFDKVVLKTGDMIFILGLRMFLVYANNKIYLAVNNPGSNTKYAHLPINDYSISKNEPFEEPSEEQEMLLYEENDYFHKMPRFFSKIEPMEMRVDAPPAKKEEDNNSMLLTVGPMLTMSMTSLVTGYTSVNNVLQGNNTWQAAIPSLVVCGAMISSAVIWPTFTKRYQKRQEKRKEKDRQEKYKAYIDSKKETIREGIEKQSQVLKNSYPSTKECEKMILDKYVSLWQRRVEDDDFLELNLGLGDYPMKININYPEEHFSMIEDNLKEMVTNLGSEPKTLTGVPVTYSFVDHFISGIIGKPELSTNFIKQLLIQLLSLHSYDDLKIIVLTDSDNYYKWKFLKVAPHSFSDDKNMRFIATNNDEYKEVCYYLDRILSKRIEDVGKTDTNKEMFKQHYLIITDNFKRIRNYDIINKILSNKRYFGFLLMIADNKVTNLPDQCKSFIQLDNNNGEIQSSHMNGTQKFEIDYQTPINYEECALKLANVPLEFDNQEEGKIPSKVGFLELYDVGKVEQLNSLSRWHNQNPIQHLEAPVGIGKNGEIVSIDLHEKFHGPHGLIAGSTGSGKSEFIISYILSMAVNYHPYEVQFILIDYKGGGLAGAFENKTTGVKLPHLVGTITNLDANEIKRSLASIESELKRRQSLFNEAREKSGESTVDIYKYQKMFRDGVVSEPISHLFIISDEFAELKTQQPEFMAQLISTSRIGRSLGVHLILATQKPSGVVDPQIWSNSRFKVCLKVQDKGDSNEVIKCPDAALIKQTGRFYFQVGYNEVFILGQAAWAGGKYYPNEKVVKNIDTSIDLINNIGYVTKTIETKEKNENLVAQGEELSSIVKYLANIAKTQNIVCRPLWLEKISDFIKVEDLAVKYSYNKEKFVINPIIGEYDIPNKQQQLLLSLPLTSEGNAICYGASGSGKENFITTLIYSSMLYDSVDEVNYYVLDFGSESLKMFKNCPLVGDVLTLDDDEKINNLFKMLTKTIEERKDLFTDYNGDYSNYCKNSGNTVPAIVVIINNFETYQENYVQYDDTLAILTRECVKYGIYFVLTANTPNGVRAKLKQNFSLLYSLQQNNNDDYTNILGNVNKVYPAKIFGRGIFKNGETYEFQTALATERDMISQYIKEKSLELSEKVNKKAPSIPTLPAIVEYKDVAKEFGKSQEMVIGIEKDSLNISKFDFKKNYITIISSLDLSITSNFVNPLINQMLVTKQGKIIVLNAENEDYKIDTNYTKYYEYYENNFDSIFEKLYKQVEDDFAKYESNNYDKEIFKDITPINCIMIGVNTIKNKLSSDNVEKFTDLFTKAKDLGTINFIFVDVVDQIKKIELESWYKNTVNANNGIWIGNGINDQFTIKISQKIDEMKQNVPDNFCFVVYKGKPTYVKYLSSLELKTK